MKEAMGYDLPEATAAQKLEVASGVLSLAGLFFAPFKALSVAIDILSLGTAAGHFAVTGDPSKVITNTVGRYAAFSVGGMVSKPSAIRYGIAVDAVSGVPAEAR